MYKSSEIFYVILIELIEQSFSREKKIVNDTDSKDALVSVGCSSKKIDILN